MPTRQADGHPYFREDSIAMPIPIAMKFIYGLPYGCPERIFLTIYFLTGCRPCEPDNMLYSNIYGNRLFWRPAKNQKGKFRYVELPITVLKEIQFMREHYRVSNQLLPYSSNTFRTDHFNRIRKQLKLDAKIPALKGGAVKLENRYLIKGFRKLYSTKRFYELWQQYGDSGIALQMVAKELRHSDKKITCQYYIVENAEELGIIKWINTPMATILQAYNQHSLNDFSPEYIQQVIKETEQKRIIEY